MTILFKVEGFTRKIYKVTGSQDDEFVWRSRTSRARTIKSQALRMTILFEVEDFTRKINNSQAIRMTSLEVLQRHQASQEIWGVGYSLFPRE